MSPDSREKETLRPVVGVLPAAGRAARIAPLPCSKELYPVGFRSVEAGGLRPKAVCHYLLEKMRMAGVTRAYIVLRHDKWDIPAYMGDGAMFNMRLAYLIMDLPCGPPYTVDQAYPFVQDSLVVFGFPDILFHPDDAFTRLLDRQAASNADVVLGIFPANQSQTKDFVEMDKSGRISSITARASLTGKRYTWIIAVWTPTFTGFMHRHLFAARERGSDASLILEQSELSVGEVIHAAIENGLTVEGVIFSEGDYLDIGTPDDLIKAVRSNTGGV